MFSPRGVMMLAQTHHEVRGYQRTAHANALQGVTTEFIGPPVKELCPIINIEGPRYPVLGALWQPRGGTARHDAVAWGYARACSDMGMDIIQKTEVTGVRSEGGRVTGVETTKGDIGCDKLGIVVAGHSGVLAERRASACRSSRSRCRRWSPSRSSPAWTWSSWPTPCTAT
jgi:sarcosine oxidase subunit beta